jgi:hypothetical protein
VWIPTPLYEALPWLSTAVGAILVAVAFLGHGGPRGLLFGAGSLALTAGLLLWMKRRDYRSAHSDYDPHSLDE